jgi:hypothetical protein
MKLSLTTSGLLDPRRLESWVPEKRSAIRKSIETAMKAAGKDIAEAVRNQMQSAFKVRKTGFIKSMRPKLYAGSLERFPALLIGSKIPWLGIHARGGTITGNGKKLLIPLLPEHQRMKRKEFSRLIANLLNSGQGFFTERGGKVILMTKTDKANNSALRRFKSAERQRTGAKSIKQGQAIPIAVLLPSVTLRKRFDLPGIVRSQLPKLTTRILEQLNHDAL